MPTYEYHCSSCKSTYELRQSFSAEATHTCEECGKGVAKRVLHAPKVVFKGSGWYVTDSRNKSASFSDSPDSADASKKAESTSEAPKEAPSTTTTTADAAAAS